MSRFVVLSASSPEALAAAEARAREALASAGGAATGRALSPTLRLVGDVPDGDDPELAGGGCRFLGAPPASPAAGLPPPFAAVVLDPTRDEVTAVTDACGLLHLYVAQGEEVAGIGTSAAALAAALGAGPDLDALGTFALLGQTFRDDAPFEGVRRTTEGQTWRLRSGGVELAAGPPPDPPTPEELGTPAEAAARGAEVLRAILGRILDAADDPCLELSGGLDSRLVLAAVPRARRAGMRALTVGDPAGTDARIASAIAAAHGLRHERVSVLGLDRWSGRAALEAAARAARAAELAANPIPRSVLDFQNDQVPSGDRVSGQNGEYARGFYYAGQREAPRPSPERVERLLRWRLLLHERVDAGLLTREFEAAALERTRRKVEEFFAARETSWLRATDEYYLRVRMHGWVGNTYSAQADARRIFCPFFDPAFLDWARRVPPAWRRGSAILAAVLAELDPDLARLPLDSGRTPAQIARGGLGTRAWRWRGTVRKLGAKALQRLWSTTASPGGAERAFRRHRERPEPLGELFPRAFSLGIVEPSLAGRSLGEAGLRWTSYGFLWNLETAAGGDPTRGSAREERAPSAPRRSASRDRT